jgi:O-antigen/teichoic acid export membrane protein
VYALPHEGRRTAINEKSVIARNTLASAWVTLLQLVTSFLFMPLLIRDFGLANYGVFLLASSASVYLSLFDFGVSPTVTKYAAQHKARDESSELAGLVSNAVAYYTAVGVVVAVLLVLFGQYGLWIFKLGPVDAALARLLFVISAAIALFAWPLSVGVSLLAGLQRYDLVARVGAWMVVGNVVATAAVVYTGKGPLVLLAALGAVTIAGSAAACALAYRELGAVRLSVRLVNRKALGVIFSFSWVLFVIQVATLAGDQQTDRLVLGVFTGAAAVGIYEAAAKLNGLVALLAGLPTVALMPAASQLDAQARPGMLRELYLRGTKYTAALVLPITVGLIVLAQPLLLEWLGLRFAANSVAAQVFLLVWLVFPNLAVAFTIFVGTGRLRFLLAFTSIHALLNLALTLLLVRPLGVLGVVLGTVITEFVMFPVGMWYTLKVLDVGPAEYVRRVVLPTYPLLLVTAVVAWGFIAAGITNTLTGVAAAGLTSVGAYWAAVFVLGMSGAERTEMRSLAASFTRRLRH